MKQNKLFDIPPDSPTRAQRIKAFKVKNEIQTHYGGATEKPWSACHMPSAFQIGEGYGLKKDDHLFEYVSQICRLLDEAGVLVCDDSEVKAIRRVCANLSLPCDL
jgi:hypothetical protein